MEKDLRAACRELGEIAQDKLRWRHLVLEAKTYFESPSQQTKYGFEEKVNFEVIHNTCDGELKSA